MSEDIKTHLETIRDIDSTGHDRGRERAQALEEVAGAVADALLAGRPVPVYIDVAGFFRIDGFEQAVAVQLAMRHETLIEQRAKLADQLEEKGVACGPEAARILRAMNAVASPVFWINPSMAKPWDIEPAQGAVMELPAMPGWQVERTPDGGAKGICESGIQFFVNGQNCGGVDVQAADQLSRRIILDEFDAGWEDSRARLAKARADLAEMKVAELKAAKPIDDFVRDAIAELGRNPETDAITHLLPVDNCWVEVKIERVVIDPLPDFDSVYPDDIQVGDHVEWHDDCGVHRWQVMSVSDWTGTKTGVVLQNLGIPFQATHYANLPLAGDPFILRPRSS